MNTAAQTLLAPHRSNLETLLEMNAAAHVDRVGRLILDGLDAQARRYLKRIARAEADMARAPEFFGPLVAAEFGQNQRGPAIQSLCTQAENQRAMGRMPVLEAAE